MGSVLHLIFRLIRLAFWYCTDFMVNLANLTHSSYNEANTWILLLLIPGLLTLLIGVRIAQWFELRRLRRTFLLPPTPSNS
ncbi:hypothetical protein LJY25_11575 [Hymenobacter sp. BT175]|uniref:hypothetical protein n=1 Tax=Hymenobacter translucens TaxID=2886507 RepID=UPI001D0F28E1|nr:hypothetical protein [Hymenobacter translucens]MCC2547089.1 hypothetical protein [Hymenobacter translucens]